MTHTPNQSQTQPVKGQTVPSSAWLGIDVSKGTLDVALLADASPTSETNQKGASVKGTLPSCRHHRFHNTSTGFEGLKQWLQQQGIVDLHVCLEATGVYGEAAALFLYEAHYQVSVVNPLRVSDFAKSQLSRDKTDARLIAHFCQSQTPPLWQPQPAHKRELQAQLRHLEALQKLQRQQQNQLEAVAASDVVRSSIESILDALEVQFAALKEQIQRHIESFEALHEQQKLLNSIPGIALLTAARLLDEVEHLATYKSARQAAAYVGLTPRQHLSGSSVRGKARLCKTGNARVRCALYFPALSAMRFNPFIQSLVRRLWKRGKPTIVIIAAAMRKLIHLAHGVLKSGRPFDPHYAPSP